MAKQGGRPDAHETTKKLVLFAATVSSFLSPFTTFCRQLSPYPP